MHCLVWRLQRIQWADNARDESYYLVIGIVVALCVASTGTGAGLGELSLDCCIGNDMTRGPT